jgi:hypothetical protein
MFNSVLYLHIEYKILVETYFNQINGITKIKVVQSSYDKKIWLHNKKKRLHGKFELFLFS